MADDRTVAVLGTGIMGAPMAHNLAGAGLSVRAWNRTRERAEPLTEHGVTVCDTPAEAVSGAGVALTMLSDGDAVEEAARGMLDALEDGAVWIQTSTVGLEAADRLAALAAESDVPFVDAPVLGTKQPAEEGQLIVLASGPEQQHERCGPVFDAIGSKTLWLGEAGAGSRLKIVVNNWITSLTTVLGETVALSRALDVDPAQFLEVISGGPLDLAYAQMKGKAMISGEVQEPSFRLSLAGKDAALVLAAAEEAGCELPVARAVHGRFTRAEELGHGDEDMAAVVFAAQGS